VNRAAKPESGLGQAPLPDLLKQELCTIVARQSVPILLPTLTAQAMLTLVAIGHVPGRLIGAWLAAIALVHVMRIFLLRRALDDSSISLDQRIRLAVAMSTVSGFVHASMVFFLPHLPLALQAIETVVILGLCAGAIAVNVGRFGIVLGFVGPIVAAFAVFWASRADAPDVPDEATAVAMLIVFFGLSMLHLSRATYRTFERSVAIRLENFELAHRLKRALEHAEAASRSKTQFLAAASHDLRQPLHALSFLTAALQMHRLDDKAREILSRMSGSLEDLSLEFDMLLDISKLDAGVVTVQPATIEAGAIVHRVALLFHEAARARGLGLTIEAQPDVHVNTDRGLLERIVRNLLDNAFKYTSSGFVQVRVRGSADRCTIEVADTGIGIPEHEQERVFEEFYQIGNEGRDRRKGLGLGLPIVKRLCDLLGVQLRMSSRPGVGTTFTLELPRVAAPIVEPAAPAPPAAGVLRDKQLLVIDDEAASREAMQGYLEGLGCSVMIAATANEAAALAQMHEPDLVVADFRLGGGESGLQAIARLRRAHPGLPAIIVTGDTAPEKLAEMSAARIPVLHKPVPPALLLEKISALLEREKEAAR
jgi:signal transduction histidine kinase/CheY-like chemotaxis protein